MFNRFPSSSGSLDVAGPQSIPKVTFTGLTYRVMTHSFIFIPLTISQTPDSYIPLLTKSTWISDWRFKPNLTNAYVFITSPSKTYPPHTPSFPISINDTFTCTAVPDLSLESSFPLLSLISHIQSTRKSSLFYSLFDSLWSTSLKPHTGKNVTGV